ncbi:hypothetical protein B0H14DRAFT_3540834, partial [Mycena olivaceomarginata]
MTAFSTHVASTTHALGICAHPIRALSSKQLSSRIRRDHLQRHASRLAQRHERRVQHALRPSTCGGASASPAVPQCRIDMHATTQPLRARYGVDRAMPRLPSSRPPSALSHPQPLNARTCWTPRSDWHYHLRSLTIAPALSLSAFIFSTVPSSLCDPRGTKLITCMGISSFALYTRAVTTRSRQQLQPTPHSCLSRTSIPPAPPTHAVLYHPGRTLSPTPRLLAPFSPTIPPRACVCSRHGRHANEGRCVEDGDGTTCKLEELSSD